MGHSVCCVPFCPNTGKNSKCTFYAFPSKIKRPEQRQKWIAAVKIQNADRSSWEPTRSDVICSDHFVGNKKSVVSNSPAYVPTIFPKQYLCRTMNATQVLNRFNRYVKRCTDSSQTTSTQTSSAKQSTTTEDYIIVGLDQNDGEPYCEIPNDKFIDNEEKSTSFQLEKASQAYIFDKNQEDQMIFRESFFCCIYKSVESEKCDVETQTDIEFPKKVINDICYKCNNKRLKTINKKCGTIKKTFRDISVETDIGNGRGSFSGFVSIESKQELLDLCGVTHENFNVLLSRIKDSHRNQISKKDRLLIFLVKIKTGLTFSALKTIFRAHRSTIARIFYLTLDQLTKATKDFIFWPSKEAVQDSLPNCFKPDYEDTRLIIDCTEFRIEIPKSVDNCVWTYSHYKKTFTCKLLVGITPSGFICFKSNAAGGRKSDSQITTESGLLDLLEAGDVVLADKGFPEFRTIVENSGKEVMVIMPPFLEQNVNFTEEQCNKTYSIAKVRIHVERIIQRLRTYRILDKIPEHLFTRIDSIIHICCVLVNLQPPIIADV